MATIKQVADAAGVSFKTVSRVINNDPAVSAATRSRVQDAIQRLGYRPNIMARHMRTQRSHVIGFITDEIATTPFAVNIIRGAENEAWNNGFLLMVVNTDCDDARAERAIEMLLERKVEGIVYATMRHKVIMPPRNLHDALAVLVNCRDEVGVLPSCVPDEIDAGDTATSALIGAGKRRIAFINLEPSAEAAVGRLEGYQRALARHNIPYDPALVRYTHLDNDKRDSAYMQMRDLLANVKPFDGVFCGNDQIAIGVYEALKEVQLRIPQDVGVVGFDNIELIAPYLRPALSTMALPHEALGRWAVRALIDGAQAGRIAPQQVKLACPLVARESV
jgi:LacI family transcriptional regulator